MVENNYDNDKWRFPGWQPDVSHIWEIVADNKPDHSLPPQDNFSKIDNSTWKRAPRQLGWTRDPNHFGKSDSCRIGRKRCERLEIWFSLTSSLIRPLPSPITSAFSLLRPPHPYDVCWQEKDAVSDERAANRQVEKGTDWQSQARCHRRHPATPGSHHHRHAIAFFRNWITTFKHQRTVIAAVRINH